MSPSDLFTTLADEFSEGLGDTARRRIGEVINECRKNEEDDKDALDEDSISNLDAELAELVEAANAARQRLAELQD